ncbi:hypothetical protein KIW84_020761 [Lathyrus oleraceus]|uniref:Uncharacterized protein n=1 Tax=Pisum sativum TaxID=3888 RepID=A0A9D5B8B5_PEA|nr:hypothetical protein KIW84_020761 [Pisum sativum]
MEYTIMKCIWYCNPRFSFFLGLNSIKNDVDILNFVEGVKGYDSVGVYVEHCVGTLDIVDESKLGHGCSDNDDVVEDVGGNNNVSDHNEVDDDGWNTNVSDHNEVMTRERTIMLLTIMRDLSQKFKVSVYLYGNWKNKFPEMDLKETMWSATRDTTIQTWEMTMLKMKTLNEDAWKEMKDILVHFWSISHFKTYSKCDMQVNNMCKAFNRAILGHKDKLVITLLEGIKHNLTKRITTQKEMMHKYAGDICHKIQFILEKNKKLAQGWTPTWHGDDDMAIFGVTNGNGTYYVNFKLGNVHVGNGA